MLLYSKCDIYVEFALFQTIKFKHPYILMNVETFSVLWRILWQRYLIVSLNWSF